MSYRAHQGFVHPARENAALWQLGAGVCVIIAVTIGLAQALQGLAFALMEEDAAWDLIAEIETARSPRGAIVLLLTTGALWVGAVAAVGLIHQRGGRTLTGPLALAIPQFVAVAVFALGVSVAVSVLPPYGTLGPLSPGLALSHWLLLLPVSLLVLTIQVTAEEVVFRGYLQQQLAARYNTPWVWIGIPSVLFGLAHYGPDIYGANAIWVVLWAGLFGAACADLTARSGTLGPAIALHLVHNATSVLLIAPQGNLSGLALYQLAFGPGDELAVARLLPVEFAMIGVLWLAARLALRR